MDKIKKTKKIGNFSIFYVLLIIEGHVKTSKIIKGGIKI